MCFLQRLVCEWTTGYFFHPLSFAVSAGGGVVLDEALRRKTKAGYTNINTVVYKLISHTNPLN